MEPATYSHDAEAIAKNEPVIFFCRAEGYGKYGVCKHEQKSGHESPQTLISKEVPRLGFEPRTKRLRVFCSTN